MSALTSDSDPLADDDDDDAETAVAEHELPAEGTSALAADPALGHWLDFFHRYHHSQGLRPVTLSMTPELVAISDTKNSRYIYEVAVRGTGAAEEWMLLGWEIDVPGIRIRSCDNQEEAMEWYGRREIYGPKVATVRLSADARPW